VSIDAGKCPMCNGDGFATPGGNGMPEEPPEPCPYCELLYHASKLQKEHDALRATDRSKAQQLYLVCMQLWRSTVCFSRERSDAHIEDMTTPVIGDWVFVTDCAVAGPLQSEPEALMGNFIEGTREDFTLMLADGTTQRWSNATMVRLPEGVRETWASLGLINGS